MTERYEIHLKGHLDQDWSTWLADFTITHEGKGRTVLVGSVVDQAALHGLLARIRDLNISILTVNNLEAQQL